MVSAAKLRRATDKAQSSRPYEREITSIISQILSEKEWKSELTTEREVKKAAIVVVATDKGLCGSLNSNLFKKVKNFLKEQAFPDVEAYVCGKKARLFCKKNNIEVVEEHRDLLKLGDFQFFKDLSGRLREKFLKGEIDQVIVFFNEFKSAMIQLPAEMTILPFRMPEEGAGNRAQVIYEPAAEVLLEKLVPMLVDFRLYRSALESFASEHAARMAAMDSASNNCRDMIGRLTLEMNRARQAAITKELMEIIGGAEAISA